MHKLHDIAFAMYVPEAVREYTVAVIVKAVNDVQSVTVYLRQSRRQMFLPVFVCLSVNKITQKRVHGFG